MKNQYEVLSPWGEVDSVALRAISPRITNMSSKTIGFFINQKPTAPLIQTVVEAKLKERFPTIKVSRYQQLQPDLSNQILDLVAYEEWVNGVDAVIAAQSD